MKEGAYLYLAHKFCQVAVWPVTLFFVAVNLTQDEQGVFFTMLSFGAFNVVAEFGFNASLVHFLTYETKGKSEVFLDSASEAPLLVKLQSMMRISLGWTFIFGGSIVVLVGIFGTIFFGLTDFSDGAVEWRLPWIIYCHAMFLNLVLLNMRSIAEGSGDLYASQLAASIGILVGGLVMAFSLSAGYRIYSLSFGLVAAAIAGILVLMPFLRNQIKLIFLKLEPDLRRELSDKFIWKRDFWPHQWRLAFSWLCGAAMFQSFVPAIYFHQGPVAAGQAGAALSIFNILNSISMVWIYRDQVKIGSAWSESSSRELGLIRRRLTFFTLATAAITGIGAFLVVFFAERYIPEFSLRVGGVVTVLPLLLGCIFLQVSNVDTAIVRFGRLEVFGRVSLCGAIIVSASNWFLADYGSPTVFASYAAFIFFVLVPWVHIVASARLRQAFKSS